MLNINAKNEFDVDSYVFDILIPRGSNVLCLGMSLNEVCHIKDSKKIIPTIVISNINKIDEAKARGLNVLYLASYIDFITMASNSYDMILANHVLCNNAEPNSFVENCCRIAKQAIITHYNSAHWRNRIRFLLYGSLFTKNPFPKNNTHKYDVWYHHAPWQIGLKEIFFLSHTTDIFIEKGIYYNGSYKLGNIFNINAYPSLFAKKIYYLLSHNVDGRVMRHTLEPSIL